MLAELHPQYGKGIHLLPVRRDLKVQRGHEKVAPDMPLELAQQARLADPADSDDVQDAGAMTDLAEFLLEDSPRAFTVDETAMQCRDPMKSGFEGHETSPVIGPNPTHQDIALRQRVMRSPTCRILAGPQTIKD
ncbi:hypothetical protein [Spongiactinospora sp. TRM90649]|uniref:hypothetical protein n=1 Tax=Spongiactinospora sp. TRM90649 TaxID=3031114 RepID=UPI0023F6C021|nr:hypothetical protein [Spongiactinospora sp. TRM90649]MDF5758808.1 hypothetical protein [Spongiactinospora sp. TRM90649]